MDDCKIDWHKPGEIPVRSFDNLIKFVENCGNLSEFERQLFVNVIKKEVTDKKLMQVQSLTDSVDLMICVCVFMLLIVFGIIGNSLVVFAVFRYRELRTARNVFILNLAISDLLLCLFTQPMNMKRLLVKYQPWVFGDVLCKMTSLFQGMNVFVSTITITAIALDRFQVIVYPTRHSIRVLEAVFCLVSIWITGTLMASPMLFFSRVYSDQYGRLSCGEDDLNLKSYKLIYTIFSIIFQYLVPIIIVTAAYIRIYYRIKCRLVNQNNQNNQTTAIQTQMLTTNESTPQKIPTKTDERRRLERNRQRRTNLLLVGISIVFAVSWLPLNIVNLYSSIKEQNMNFTVAFGRNGRIAKRNIANMTLSNTTSLIPYSTTNNNSNLEMNHFMFIINTICLLLVLCTACINPILYGWLNDNFRKFLRQFFHFSICTRAGTNRQRIDVTTTFQRTAV